MNKFIIILLIFSVFSCVEEERNDNDDTIVDIIVENSLFDRLNKNIFGNLNTDLNYYYTNEYNVISPVDWFYNIDGSRFTLVKTEDNIFEIWFYDDIISGIKIFKNTALHILSKYIGYDINEIVNIFGEPDNIYIDIYYTKEFTYFNPSIVEGAKISFITNEQSEIISSISIFTDTGINDETELNLYDIYF